MPTAKESLDKSYAPLNGKSIIVLIQEPSSGKPALALRYTSDDKKPIDKIANKFKSPLPITCKDGSHSVTLSILQIAGLAMTGTPRIVRELHAAVQGGEGNADAKAFVQNPTLLPPWFALDHEGAANRTGPIAAICGLTSITEHSRYNKASADVAAMKAASTQGKRPDECIFVYRDTFIHPVAAYKAGDEVPGAWLMHAYKLEKPLQYKIGKDSLLFESVEDALQAAKIGKLISELSAPDFQAYLDIKPPLAIEIIEELELAKVQLIKGGAKGGQAQAFLNKTKLSNKKTINETFIDFFGYANLTRWKKEVADALNEKKFRENPTLSTLLIQTGDAPIFAANIEDSKWGMGPDGAGENLCGKSVMAVRNILQLAQRARSVSPPSPPTNMYTFLKNLKDNLMHLTQLFDKDFELHIDRSMHSYREASLYITANDSKNRETIAKVIMEIHCMPVIGSIAHPEAQSAHYPRSGTVQGADQPCLIIHATRVIELINKLKMQSNVDLIAFNRTVGISTLAVNPRRPSSGYWL